VGFSSVLLAFLAVIGGLALLVWSADRFVDGAAATANHLSVPPLLIGMVIVGFGTSAPEMVVSAIAASQGNPGLALGNAYGSNIANIALILGVTALVCPIAVQSQVIRKEIPLLIAVTAIAAYQLIDFRLSRMDAAVLLAVFAVIMGWSIYQGLKGRGDPLGDGQLCEDFVRERRIVLLQFGRNHEVLAVVRGDMSGTESRDRTESNEQQEVFHDEPRLRPSR